MDSSIISSREELDLLSEVETKICQGENMEKIEKLIIDNERENRLIFAAAKQGKSSVLKFLISCNVKVNVFDDEQYLPIDYVWKQKNYALVLFLLKADSKYPNGFNLNQIGGDNEDEKKLKKFVEERNWFHELIKNDNLDTLKTYVNNKSFYYLNDQNQTALYTAVQRKKFEIYGYLKSRGAKFLNYFEEIELDKLSLSDKYALRRAMVSFFTPVSESHIYYLISKSRSQRPMDGLKEKIHYFFSKLDEIPEISIILQVIQHSDYLDIVFDFDEENVSRIDPMATKHTLGEANYKEGRLFIAASPTRGEKNILGTTAHELTHMAMQLLFENECNPYDATDKVGEKNFQKIKSTIHKNIKTKRDDPSQPILNVFKSYPSTEHHSELIVTVPQILISYENGKKWLADNVTILYDFYSSVIIPKCLEFITQSPVLKAKKAVKKLNETLGEITKLKKSNITFENVKGDVIKDFFTKNKEKIFLMETQYTYLGMVKVLQGIFGKAFIHAYDKYLVFNFQNLMSEFTEVMQTFCLNACNILIIRFHQNFDKQKSLKFFEVLSEIQHNSVKKIIFIIHPKLEETLHKLLKKEYLLYIYKKEKDVYSSFHYLDSGSKKIILQKEIVFQGRKIVLKELIGESENLHNLITGDIIENLIDDKEIHIGGRLYDLSDLESSYNRLCETTNLKSLMREFKKSNDVFIFKGLPGSNKEERLISCFKQYIAQKIIDQESIIGQIQNISFERLESTTKRLLVTDEFLDKDIKKFCHQNSKKKIGFIDIKNESKFVLRQLYNPDFYMERKFEVTVLKTDDLENLLSELETENFIISRKHYLAHFKLHKLYSNLQILNLEDAETNFKGFIEKKAIVHWFFVNDSNEIFWINSSGSIKNLRAFLENQEKSFVKEQDMAEYLVYRRIVIIADNPGMGKTTTLTKLHQNDSILKTHWILRINLKEKAMHLKSYDFSNFNISDLIEILRKMELNLESKLDQDLFRSALISENDFPKQLLLVFDGFDEISDEEDRNNIISLLQYLQKNTKSKIWVTTRMNYQTLLEDKLSTFALEFSPLDKEEKKIFIKKFLENRLKLIIDAELGNEIFGKDVNESPKMKTYTEEFLKHMKIVFGKNISAFNGTPCQLRLLVENSVEHFKNWIENKGKLDFSHFREKNLGRLRKFQH